MTYTDFLKSHFGEDGSLARVLQALGDTYGYHSRFILNASTLVRMATRDENAHKEAILWSLSEDLFGQFAET